MQLDLHTKDIRCGWAIMLLTLGMLLGAHAAPAGASTVQQPPSEARQSVDDEHLPLAIPAIYEWYIDLLELPPDIDARVRFFLLEQLTAEERAMTVSPGMAQRIREHLALHWGHLMGDGKLHFLADMASKPSSSLTPERQAEQMRERAIVHTRRTEEHRREQWILAPHQALTIRQNVMAAIQFESDPALRERREQIVRQAEQLADWYVELVESQLRPIIQVEAAWALDGPKPLLAKGIVKYRDRIRVTMQDHFLAAFRRPLTEADLAAVKARVLVRCDEILAKQVELANTSQYEFMLDWTPKIPRDRGRRFPPGYSIPPVEGFSILTYDQSPIREVLDERGGPFDDLDPHDLAVFNLLGQFGYDTAKFIATELLYTAGRISDRLEGLEQDPIVFPLDPKPSERSWGFIAGMRLEMTFFDPRYKHLNQQKHWPGDVDESGPVPDLSTPFRPDTRLDPSAPKGPMPIFSHSPSDTAAEIMKP